jgi:nucleoside phosphorylase
METSQLEALLSKIEKLKSIMIDVSTGEAQIQDLEEAYTQIFREADLYIELLQEENTADSEFMCCISISNPNSFASLWDWYNYWSSNLDNYASRRKYIYDLYVGITDSIENALQKQFIHNETNISHDVLQPDKLETLLVEIQNLQSIMVDVATGSASIQTEETGYIGLYQEVASCIRRLQQVGLPTKNPNSFSSLWHWHSYWKSELGNYASRRQFVGELYTSVVTPIQKALWKHQHRSTSIEQFVEDLERRFKNQVLEQPSDSVAVSTEADGDTNTKTLDVQARSTKILEADSTRATDTQLPAVLSSTELLVDFAIIIAIEKERLAILEAFEIDEDKDRVFRGSRVYWQKQVSLGYGKFYEVRVTQLLDMANVDAAISTVYAIEDWKPAVLLMVGIAAAANEDQQLGDLVVGTEIYYYERGKETNVRKLPEPKMHSADATLLGRFNALPQNVKQTFPIRIPRPDQLNTRPKVYSGVIASGEKVIASEAVREDVQFGHRKIKAIEMEGYGVSRAVWQQFDQVRCLVIRALCDYADSNKHDQWHPYAAAVAAGFTKAFLLDKPLEPRNQPKVYS